MYVVLLDIIYDSIIFFPRYYTHPSVHLSQIIIKPMVTTKIIPMAL